MSARLSVDESNSEGIAHQQLSGSSPVAPSSPRWVSVSFLQSVSSACLFCGVAVNVKVDSSSLLAVTT